METGVHIVSSIYKSNRYFIFRDCKTEVVVDVFSTGYNSSHTLYDFERKFVEKYLVKK